MLGIGAIGLAERFENVKNNFFCVMSVAVGSCTSRWYYQACLQKTMAEHLPSWTKCLADQVENLKKTKSLRDVGRGWELDQKVALPTLFTKNYGRTFHFLDQVPGRTFQVLNFSFLGVFSVFFSTFSCVFLRRKCFGEVKRSLRRMTHALRDYI